jgi:NAD(P)-dependent dehydrogenase (short-subunit alcohol dehydrogenase family)
MSNENCISLIFQHSEEHFRFELHIKSMHLWAHFQAISRFLKAKILTPTILNPKLDNMSTNFAGKVIALTGGASGIGLETSKMLASRGATVCIADVQEKMLAQAVSAIESGGGKVSSQVVNVRDRKAVESWIASIVNQYGKLDGAVNLAGVIGKQIGIANVEDIDDAEWDFIMGVNTTGVMICMSAEIKAMTKGGKGGSIVNAASVAGVLGMEKNGAYIASKHAVVGLTRAAAKECGLRAIRVNAIAPYVSPIGFLLVDTQAKFNIGDQLIHRW